MSRFRFFLSLALACLLGAAHAAPISIVDSGTVVLASGDPWTVTDEQLGSLDFTATASQAAERLFLRAGARQN